MSRRFLADTVDDLVEDELLYTVDDRSLFLTAPQILARIQRHRQRDEITLELVEAALELAYDRGEVVRTGEQRLSVGYDRLDTSPIILPPAYRMKGVRNAD